jgi:hypothetical protein
MGNGRKPSAVCLLVEPGLSQASVVATAVVTSLSMVPYSRMQPLGQPHRPGGHPWVCEVWCVQLSADNCLRACVRAASLVTPDSSCWRAECPPGSVKRCVGTGSW